MASDAHYLFGGTEIHWISAGKYHPLTAIGKEKMVLNNKIIFNVSYIPRKQGLGGGWRLREKGTHISLALATRSHKTGKGSV